MSKARVLIADDDRLVLATLASGLRDVGYITFEANDGEEAVCLCKEVQPDIAILDIRMPGMDGIEAARHLQGLTGTPFLMLSAYGDEDLVEKSTDLGALGYLVKPIDVEQIVPAIEAALKRASQIKKLQDSKSRLASALENDQLISTAVGVVMERHHLSREEAFQKLRTFARSQRRRLAEVSNNLIKAVETTNIR